MDETQETAVAAYLKKTGRLYIPGEVVEIPLDALVFAEYQQPWTTLESYETSRCIYDQETNDWLIWLVTEAFQVNDVPPIYVDILPDGVALVDGCHRTTSAFVNGDTTILAHVNMA